MFRSRKRKVSPDKKTDKTKKLKVSNKIFRSPNTTKPNSEAKAKLSRLLPDGYDSIILTANTKPDESFEENEAVFGCVRLPILTKEDAMVWVKKFETKTFTSYRTQRTWKKDVNTGLFKRKYICNVRSKDVAVQSAAATCKGSIIFTIKDQEEIQANPDYYLRDYPSQVIIHFCHNHKIDPDNYMKNLRPTAELRIIFGTYFAKGHSPFSALICHKCDLHSSYGAEFYNVVSNGAICPSYNWCFHEYEKFFMRKFIEPSEDKLYEKLSEGVIQYNAKWRSECAVVAYSPMFVLSICTPLMKSVFRSGFAEELITVRCFSTPKSVPKRQKLILFLCHTPIGSLPFGVVVTFAEDTENVCEGIRALIKMFGVTSYSPKTIIIDENALISKSLKKCFPTAQILFNEFQMLQSIWRIIRVVCPNDDEEFQSLYNLFLVTLNSNSEEEFNKNFDSLLVYAEKFPKLTNFLKYFKVRSTSYVLYARPKIEFNTDVLNYTDSGTIILQDVSIKYGNFFNIVQLFDFVSKSYVDHYERKLNKIVEGDLKGFFKTNFYVPLSKIADFTCEKISDTEFLVSLNEMKFFVNAELDTCTCQVGVHGGSCVHQYIVEKNLGLVPECYTPLCDDMLGIFRNILKEKNIRPPLPDNNRYSELGNTLESIKSELESVEDVDELSDVVSSVCCSEISNFSGMPHDMDHLCPMEEIFLAPPDINESFTDITDEAMSPLVLSEFDDNNEESEDFLDDSQQYNRESGELEPIESLKGTQELKNTQNNVLVDGLASNLEQSIPTTGYFLNQDNSDNVIIYEYTEDDIKCNNEVEIVEHCGSVDGETLVRLPTDGSIVYTYSGGKQNQVTFIKDEMNESDRKTAEIAEFLTNLPDTNNSNQNIPHYILDKGRVVEQKQTVSNGVVVVRNEEYFTNYEVLENNVLSVVTEATDAFSPNFGATSDSAQDLITSSYEDNNFVMMSPNDLFDDNQNAELDKQDNKINVLSSVVIKPSAGNSSKYVPTYTPGFPINLNAIKHKTLRNVKEDSRIRMSEQKTTQSGSTIFIQDSSKSEPRKIVLPIVKKESNLKGVKSNDENKYNQSYEKDVIKLYCNQSSEKPLLKDAQEEAEILQQEVILDTAQSKDECGQENVPSHTQILCQFEGDSQELQEYLIDSEVDVQECEKEVLNSKEILDCDSKSNSQEFETNSNDAVQTNDNSALYNGDLLFADCDPEELAKNEFVEIVEIDSDGLEELASQDPYSIASTVPSKQEFVQPSFSEISLVKVIPLKNLPFNMIPFKSFSKDNTPLASKCLSLRDFMSKTAPSKISLPQKLSSEVEGLENISTDNKFSKVSSPVDSKSKSLQKQVTASLSQPQRLVDRCKFKMVPKTNPNVLKPDARINEQVKHENEEVATSKENKNRGSTVKTFKAETHEVKLTMDDSDSNEYSSSEFEDISDSFENNVSGVDELSENELYELQYLWDEDSSDESGNEEELEYREPVTQSNKLGVKSLQKTSMPVSSRLRSDDKLISTDKPKLNQKLPPGITLTPIAKEVDKVIEKASTIKTDLSQNIDSANSNSSKIIDATNEKQGNKLPASFHIKNKSAETSKTKSQDVNKLNATIEQSQSFDFGHNKLVASHCGTNKDKDQLLSQTNKIIKSPDKNKKQTKESSILTETKTKKSIIENPSKTNYDGSSNYIKNTSSIGNKSLNDPGQDRTAKQTTYETAGIIDVLRTAKKKNIPLDKVSSDQTNVLAEKRNNTNRETKGNKKLTANQIKQKINTGIFNIKNKALVSTLIKLDSLPNILLRPCNQPVARKNKMQSNNLNTNILKGKKSSGAAITSNSDRFDTDEVRYEDSESESELLTDSFSVSKFSQHKDKAISNKDIKTERSKKDLLLNKCRPVETNIVKPIKKQNLKPKSSTSQDKLPLSRFVRDKSVTAKTPKQNLTSSLDLLKPLRKGNKACDKIQKKKLKPTLAVTGEKIPANQNSVTQMGKDIEDLEAILSSDKDVDRDLSSNVKNIDTKNTSTAKILENDDLSFLFDDPRFETVVEEETLPSPMVTGQGTVDMSLRKAINKNIKSNVKHSPMVSDIHEESMLSGRRKEATKKKKSSKKTRKRKYDSLNASIGGVKKEPHSEKLVKYTDNLTLMQQDQTTDNKTSQLVQLIQEGQDRVITLLVYTSVPKGITPNTPIGKSSYQRKSIRKILPKPDAKVEDNKELLTFSDEMIELGVNTSENDDKDTNSKSRRSTSNSKAMKLEPSVKIEDVHSNESNRIRRIRASSRKPADALNYIKSDPENFADIDIKQENTSEMTVSDSLHPSAQSVILNAKARQMQEVDLSNRAISNKGVRTRSQSRKSGSLKDDGNDFLKSMGTPSNMEHRRISLRKEKITKNPTSPRKKLSAEVKDQPKDGIVIDKKRRSVPHRSEKTSINRVEDLTPEKGKSNIIQADNVKRKQTKENSYKISLPRKDKYPVSKLKKAVLDSNYSPASPIRKYESHDLENSITASILEKQNKPIETDGLISSTPRRSIGYEDAYKIFLETSNRWPSKTIHGQSDCENDTEFELSGGLRRRTKSVSSPKEQSIDSEKLQTGKMKKSVSWAEGLNVIEYIQESDTDSDDSEIREISRIRAFREKQKELSNEKCISKKHNRVAASYKERQISLAKADNSFSLENKLKRSRSATPKLNNSKNKTKKRSRSYSRAKSNEIKLVVLLERNKEIDRKCYDLRDQNRSCSLRSRGRERVGYKELLHRARLSKNVYA